MKSLTIRKISQYLRDRGAIEAAIKLEDEVLEMERERAAMQDALCGLLQADRANWTQRRDHALKLLVNMGAPCA